MHLPVFATIDPVTTAHRAGRAWSREFRLLSWFGLSVGIALFAGAEAQATKATAPFEITTQFSGNHASVAVRALSPARDVVVEISGSDGLVVLGGKLHGTVQVKEFRRDSVVAAEVLMFEVDFTPGGARSLLAVSVDCAGEPALVRGFLPADAAKLPPPAAGAAAAPGPVLPGPAQLGWPINADAKFDAAHKHAHVTVTTSKPGTDIVVKLYGLDGMVVANGTPEGNLIVRTERRAVLKPGESYELEVAVQPGEGQSSLVVAAQGQNIGSIVHSFPVGELSEAQKRERQRGVTVDPEGRPVRIMNP